jgi:hypothetical protein
MPHPVLWPACTAEFHRLPSDSPQSPLLTYPRYNAGQCARPAGDAAAGK